MTGEEQTRFALVGNGCQAVQCLGHARPQTEALNRTLASACWVVRPRATLLVEFDILLRAVGPMLHALPSRDCDLRRGCLGRAMVGDTVPAGLSCLHESMFRVTTLGLCLPSGSLLVGVPIKKTLPSCRR